VLFFNVRAFAVFAMPMVFLNQGNILLPSITLLLFVSFLAWRLRSCDLSFRIPFPFLTALIVIVGLYGFSRSIDLELGRFFFIYSILLPLLAFLVYYNLQPSTREIRTTLMIICGIAAILGWISLVISFQTGIPRQVFTWGYGSQNRGAGFFGLLLPFALISMIDARGKRDFFPWIFIFLGILAGILNTQTRAILFAIVMSVFYIGFRDRRPLKILIPLLLAVVILMPSLVITRMAMLFGFSTEVDWSSVGRVQIWLNSLDFIPKYFLFGMGIGNFSHIYPIDHPFAFLKAVHPHNEYARYLFDYGIFGLIGFVLFVFGCLRRGHRTVAEVRAQVWNDEARTLIGINAGIICLLIAGLVDVFLKDMRIAMLFWVMLSFQLVLSQRATAARGASYEEND